MTSQFSYKDPPPPPEIQGLPPPTEGARHRNLIPPNQMWTLNLNSAARMTHSMTVGEAGSAEISSAAAAALPRGNYSNQ